MTKQELKDLIRECVSEVLDESVDNIELQEATDINAEVEAIADLYEYEVPTFDEDDASLEEGANLDMRAKYKEAKPKIKANFKALKQAIKSKDKAEATKCYNEVMQQITNLEKDIKAIPSTAGSAVFGYFTGFTITYIRDIIISLFVPFGFAVLPLQELVNSLRQLIADIKDKDASAADTLNYYRNRLLSQVALMKRTVSKVKPKIDAL